MRKRVLWFTCLVCLCVGPQAASAIVWQETPTADTLVAHVRRALGRGDVERARALLTTVQAPAGPVETSTALIEVFEGKWTDARARLTPLVESGNNPDALLELGLLDLREGRRSSGQALMGQLLQQTFDLGPDNLFRMARAARAVGDFRLANTLYQRIEASPLQKADVEASWGDLFAEKDQLAEALTSYRAALAADPAWIPAYLGLVAVIPQLADVDPAEAAAALETARKLAPNHPDVWLVTADERLASEDWPGAREALDRVATVRRGAPEELALRAALAYAEGNRAEMTALIDRVKAINPLFSRAPLAVGEQAARLYRFDDAAAFARTATTWADDDPRTHGALGLYLMRTGDEAGARTALERAFKLDPYNRGTYNLLLSLDLVDGFETVESGPFIFKFAKQDAELLKVYALPLAMRAYETFSERYGLPPDGPILIEVFDKHDDFAVRTLGLPGLVGALGACFGRVITMDSPRARDPGTFSWQATLWHEIAHVFSLQASDYRVPRWLTEGISVFEEHRYNRAWGRELILEYARALSAKRTFGVKGLANAFQRPHDLALAYFEASLLTEHLVSINGDAGLRSLLAAYAGGAKDADAFAQAFGKTVDEVEASFNAFVEEGYGALARALAAAEFEGGRASGPQTVESLQAIVEKAPGSYMAQWALGRALVERGDADAARAALERAVALAPMGQGNDSPRALLADLAVKAGQAEQARRHLRELLSWDHDNIDAAKRLASLARQAGADEDESYALKVVADVYPFDVDAHVQLGRRALARKDYQGALTELEAVLALGPTNRAEAHADLGEALLGLGRSADAKAQALKALELAPTYARAQDLLLATIKRQ